MNSRITQKTDLKYKIWNVSQTDSGWSTFPGNYYIENWGKKGYSMCRQGISADMHVYVFIPGTGVNGLSPPPPPKGFSPFFTSLFPSAWVGYLQIWWGTCIPSWGGGG